VLTKAGMIRDARIERQKMVRVAQFVFTALILVSPAVALAGSAEDANVAVDRWSAAYSSNDPETIAKNYWPDAILLGTVSPVLSEGTDAIVTYFTPTKGSGNKNTIDERRTIVINDNAVVVTGFYTFTRMVDGKPVPGRFRGRHASPCWSLGVEMNGG
jgi:uncharacterized protein (TIGR02246 family)